MTVKISQLPAGSALAGTEPIPTVQTVSGTLTTVATTPADVVVYVQGQPLSTAQVQQVIGNFVPTADNTDSVGSSTKRIAASYVTQSYVGANNTPVLNGGVVGYWPITSAESGTSLTPVNYAIPSNLGLVQSSRYNASNTWDYRTDQRLFEIYLSKYGAVFNGTTDDTAALADAINAMQALWGGNAPRRVFMPSGGLTAKINTAGALTFYCGAVGIDFNGLILDATGLTSGVAVTVAGAGASPYSAYANSAPVENFNLLGSSSDTATTVMLSVTGNTPKAGEVAGGFLRNFRVMGGSVGMDILSNVYVLAIDNGSFFNQTQYGVRFTGGAASGENISFHGGVIGNVFNSSNTGVGLYLTTGAADADFNIFGMSIDYCNQLISQLSGRLTLTGCHLESGVTAPITSIPKFIDVQQAAATGYSSAFRMKGGVLYIGGSSAPSAIITASNANQTTIELDTTIENPNHWAVQLLNVTDTSTPSVEVSATSLQYWNAPVLYGPINEIYNGGFETGTLGGWTQSSATITWSAQSTTKHSGTYALEGTAATAQSSSIYQVIPVKTGQRTLSNVWLNVTSHTAGSVGASVKFYQDAALSVEIGNGYTAALESATTAGWVESTATGIVPAGANYMGVVVYGSGFEGTFYVDDIAVAVF